MVIAVSSVHGLVHVDLPNTHITSAMTTDTGGEMLPGGFGAALHDVANSDGNMGVSSSFDAISEFPEGVGLPSDPIESFSGPGAEFANDVGSQEKFDLFHGSAVSDDGFSHVCMLPEKGGSGAEGPGSAGYEPSLVDQDGYNSFRAMDDTSDCLSTVLDSHLSCSDIPDHARTQQQLSQTLEPEMPSFLWEQGGFLGAVFGKKNLVDELFPAATFKRPPSAMIDLTESRLSESPNKKAFYI